MFFFRSRRSAAPDTDEDAGAPGDAPLEIVAGDPITPREQPAARHTPASGHHRRRGLIARLPWRWRLAVRIPLYGCSAVAAGIGALFVYYTMVWPDPLGMRHRERAPVIRILAHDGSLLAERGTASDYMPLDLLPSHVRSAVIATEDHRFYEHFGLDPLGLMRASFRNLRAGRYVQGGSTLTQQLAKNLFLTSERTMERKLEEVLLALWLEIRLTKDEILELYLNRVYFGSGAYGIEAAAKRYFDKSARDLTLAEAAVLAGLLKAPSRYSPASSPGAARARARTVLKRMLEAGLITATAEHSARQDSVRFADTRSSREPTGVDYAVDFVLERLPALSAPGNTELIVETTFDAALQRRAQTLVHDVMAKQGAAMSAGQAALAVLATDGSIRAIVGGISYADSQFNRAVKARRQPGSSFKTVLYLAALESGLTPDSTVYDLPVTVGGWAPRNDNGTYQGAMPLKSAFAHSINAVAVRLQIDLGIKRSIDMGRRLGIAATLREEPSLALGTSEVSVLQMAGAYATIAARGIQASPHAIERVRTGSGRIVYVRKQRPGIRAVAETHALAMDEMLVNAVERGTGRRALIPGHAVAGKTGTTQDFRDAWFVGYAGGLAAAVWVGNDDGRPMSKVSGGSLPAQIWHDVIAETIGARPAPHTAGRPLPAREPAASPQPPPVPTRQPPGARATEVPAAVPATTTSAPRATAPRLDEDFLSRVLAEPTTAPAAEDPAQAVQRPHGLISLGIRRD